MAGAETRVTKLEEEYQKLQGQIDDLHERLDAQGKRTDAVNDSMRAMLARFEVGGGYPGGVDAMTRDFRACFHERL
jgi:uncharacterized coiled-coil protein SlyX